MKKLITLSFFIFISNMIIHAQVTANAGADKENCLNDSIKVTGTGLSQGDVGTYQWKDLSSNSVVSNNEFLKMKSTNIGTKLYELKVTKTVNSITYTDYDSFELITHALPTISGFSMAANCYNSGKRILDVVTANGGNKDKIKYWDKKGWVTGGPAGTNWFYYDFASNISNDHVPKTGLRDSIFFSYTDDNGCVNSGKSTIRLYPAPTVVTQESVICQLNGDYELYNSVIHPVSQVRIGGISTFKCLKVPTNSGVNPDSVIYKDTTVVPLKWMFDPGTANQSNRQGEYIIQYCFQDGLTGCLSCDTSILTVIPLPEYEQTKDKFCANDGKIMLDSTVRNKKDNKRPFMSAWQDLTYSNCITNFKEFNTACQTGTHQLVINDYFTGCNTSDTLTYIVNGLPQVTLTTPDTIFNDKDSVALMSNYQGNSNGKWYGDEINANGTIYIDDIDFMGMWSVTKTYKYCFTNPTTSCTNCDSVTVVFMDTAFNGNGASVNQLKNNWVKSYPNPVIDVLHFDNIRINAYSIVDNTGKLIIQNSDLDQSFVDFREIKSGVYMLKIESENRTVWLKVIKH